MGFKDPLELGYERTFKTKKHDRTDGYALVGDAFTAYLYNLRFQMRACLDKSEKARDTFYVLKDAYEGERNLTGPELEAAMKNNAKAQAAVADNIMYDRWATKYAAVLQAEIAYANFTGRMC